jgi:hypothetical protein
MPTCGHPRRPGREARRDNEYERRGAAIVFCAAEPKAGPHFTFATPDRSGFEFAQVAVTLVMECPEAKTIHLVMNNLNIHRRKALVDVFGPEMVAEVWDRFAVHYTPTHGSWLSQRRSKSASSHGNVRALGEFPSSKHYAKRRKPGTGA